MYVYGVGASDGISVGKAFVIREVNFKIPTHKSKDAVASLQEFEDAIRKTEEEILLLKENAIEAMGEKHSDVFNAHLQIARDPVLFSEVKEYIELSKMNAPRAYSKVIKSYMSKFMSMDNAYMKERLIDVKDVSNRVLANLLGVTLNVASSITSDHIICAHELAPGDTVRFNKNYIKGLVSAAGSLTSHSSIMSRSLKIPSVVGIEKLLDIVKDGDTIIVNGYEGYILTNPTEYDIDHHARLKKDYIDRSESYEKYKQVSCFTKDNVRIELSANISAPEDIDGVLDIGVDGIGLFRTEFMYMGQNKLPTEDEQYYAYRSVLERMQDKKVVIRTLDIGGDKQLKYLPADENVNPSLGYRGLRYTLANVQIFRTQLRALLRASSCGNLHIMFPMVATIGELRRAKSLLQEFEQELRGEGKRISSNYKVGIMVEIPSVAVIADQFAKEVDFFSIGTNDLIQYLFAADRSNSKVAYLYQPLNPSFLRMIKQVIDASHKEGIWTGLCGEVAGDPIVAPILLGLGLDEFSMDATRVLEIRQLLSNLSKEKMENLARRALKLSTEHEVKNMLRKYLGH